MLLPILAAVAVIGAVLKPQVAKEVLNAVVHPINTITPIISPTKVFQLGDMVSFTGAAVNSAPMTVIGYGRKLDLNLTYKLGAMGAKPGAPIMGEFVAEQLKKVVS